MEQERKNILKSISRWLKKDIWAALTLAGVKENSITGYVHKWKDIHDGEYLLTFIKTLAPPAKELLNHYKIHPPEMWKNLKIAEMGRAVFPEIRQLNKLKRELKTEWNKRPRFGVQGALKRKKRK